MTEIETNKKEEQERTTKKKALFIEEFKKSFGIITVACLRAGIQRDTYYDWINNDYVFKAQCDAVGDIQTDFVVDKLLIMIADSTTKGHEGAVKFYLSRVSSKFKEKLELSGDTSLIAKYADVSNEQLYEMMEKARGRLEGLIKKKENDTSESTSE